jgi:Tfp pilus assembly protein PilN
MRAVNLIPPDARRGDRVALRTGAISYVIVGALALGLLGAVALGLTSKQVSDRKAEVASLEQEEAAAEARAQSLQQFASFRAVEESRAATVTSLAQSRFDWDRVLNELARVIPSDVWLVQLEGTVNPNVSLEAGPDISIRDSVPGPALAIVGCAASQDAVAGFVADLEDIDGVTRVGLQSSERSEESAGGAATATPTSPGSDTQNSGECRTRDFISRFEIVAAFDAIPTPPTASAAPSVPSSVAPSTSSSTSTSTPSTSAPASSSTVVGG